MAMNKILIALIAAVSLTGFINVWAMYGNDHFDLEGYGLKAAQQVGARQERRRAEERMQQFSDIKDEEFRQQELKFQAEQDALKKILREEYLKQQGKVCDLKQQTKILQHEVDCLQRMSDASEQRMERVSEYYEKKEQEAERLHTQLITEKETQCKKAHQTIRDLEQKINYERTTKRQQSGELGLKIAELASEKATTKALRQENRQIRQQIAHQTARIRQLEAGNQPDLQQLQTDAALREQVITDLTNHNTELQRELEQKTLKNILLSFFYKYRAVFAGTAPAIIAASIMYKAHHTAQKYSETKPTKRSEKWLIHVDTLVKKYKIRTASAVTLTCILAAALADIAGDDSCIKTRWGI